MNKRESYPDHRKYQSWQLKRLLRQMECNLTDHPTHILSTRDHEKRLKETKEMLGEITLRLD
jgi:hypothetical protein